MFRLLLLGCMETAFAFAFLVSLVYGSASDTESRQSHLLFENGTAASSALSSSQISGFGSNGGEMNETKKLFDVTPLANDTGGLFSRANLRKLVDDPYVHGIILPAIAGLLVALLIIVFLCTIQLCMRAHIRQRRRLRIKHLADELKSDRTMIVAPDSSDDEI